MAQAGIEDEKQAASKRHWWDYLIVAVAIGLFVWFAASASVPPLAMNMKWVAALCLVLALLLFGAGWVLWKRTRFF